ncbi:MAG: FkbM family methyltransferase [Bacteroidota bacterium]|nr:FkbM family methyltransferase [Bacteroidota bacterium]MDP4234791.1 FkbM family methyltransferase [Bacteroidota bacterium]MDP4244103.1 FkbM family methyltransferase [Bacteroidota bacterium]MDP4289435.1 FkbM family methyltransferase [Bacteroidota bacterium]
MTKDRGRMILDVDDWTQYTMYYNLYEAKYDKVMLALMKDTNVVLDIGGNVGQHTLWFARYARKVYSFEPLPRLADRIRREIALNHLESKVVLVTKALSDEAKSLVITDPDRGMSGNASTILGRSPNEKTIAIQAIRLDDFLESEGVKTVDLVNIDIEGAELFALRGMPNLLRNSAPPLVLEMNELMMGLAGYTFEEVQNYLAEFGYRPFQMVKTGLIGPVKKIISDSENFCFLTEKHLAMPKIKSLISQA